MEWYTYVKCGQKVLIFGLLVRPGEIKWFLVLGLGTRFLLALLLVSSHWPYDLRSVYDQTKVTYEVDRRNKFRFYLRVFFDFVDISVLNSNTLYDKMESAEPISSLNFRFSLARSMIGKVSNRKRAVPTSRPSKWSKGDSFDVVDHLPEFATTRAHCALCSFKNIENWTFIRCSSCNNCFYNNHFNQWTLSKTPNFNCNLGIIMTSLIFSMICNTLNIVEFFIVPFLQYKKHWNNPI